MSYSPDLNLMLSAVNKASRILIRDFGELEFLQSSKKGTLDYALKSKEKIEQVLIDELTLARKHGIIVNDKVIKHDPDNNWIIDPINGFNNFTHAVPSFAIFIALEKINYKGEKEIAAIIIAAPAIGEIYFAEKGHGAWVEKYNDMRATSSRSRVSSRQNFANAIFVLTNYDELTNLSLFKNNVISEMQITIGHSVALSIAYISAGRYDMLLCNQEDFVVKYGMLLIREAGGMFLEVNNKTIVSNEYFNKELLRIFNK